MQLNDLDYFPYLGHGKLMVSVDVNRNRGLYSRVNNVETMITMIIIIMTRQTMMIGALLITMVMIYVDNNDNDTDSGNDMV